MLKGIKYKMVNLCILMSQSLPCVWISLPDPFKLTHMQDWQDVYRHCTDAKTRWHLGIGYSRLVTSEACTFRVAIFRFLVYWPNGPFAKLPLVFELCMYFIISFFP